MTRSLRLLQPRHRRCLVRRAIPGLPIALSCTQSVRNAGFSLFEAIFAGGPLDGPIRFWTHFQKKLKKTLG